MSEDQRTLMAYCILRQALYITFRYMRKNHVIDNLFDSDYAEDTFNLLDGFAASEIYECEALAESMFHSIVDWITVSHAQELAAYIKSKSKGETA
jgi:hypothetical protein